jgi:hypothetical protein
MFIYGATALVVFLGIRAVKEDPGSILFWLLFTLCIYLGGHYIASGRLSSAYTQVEKDWREELYKPANVRLSSRVKRKLLPNETVVVVFHEHPMSVAPWWALGAFIWLVLINIGISKGHWGAIAIAALIVAGFVAYKTINWRRSIWLVTDVRVLRVYGLITDRQSIMSIQRLTDAAVNPPWWSTTLAHLRIIYLPVGAVRLETAGQTQAIESVKLIPDIERVAKTIQIYALRFGSQFEGLREAVSELADEVGQSAKPDSPPEPPASPGNTGNGTGDRGPGKPPSPSQPTGRQFAAGTEGQGTEVLPARQPTSGEPVPQPDEWAVDPEGGKSPIRSAPAEPTVKLLARIAHRLGFLHHPSWHTDNTEGGVKKWFCPECQQEYPPPK